MNDMIERVSEAILNTPNASDYKELVAKNAIRAMREPTEEMYKVGASMTISAQSGSIDIEEVWQTMIDEALK